MAFGVSVACAWGMGERIGLSFEGKTPGQIALEVMNFGPRVTANCEVLRAESQRRNQ